MAFPVINGKLFLTFFSPPSCADFKIRVLFLKKQILKTACPARQHTGYKPAQAVSLFISTLHLFYSTLHC
jgi:hypothetical protein